MLGMVISMEDELVVEIEEVTIFVRVIELGVAILENMVMTIILDEINI